MEQSCDVSKAIQFEIAHFTLGIKARKLYSDIRTGWKSESMKNIWTNKTVFREAHSGEQPYQIQMFTCIHKFYELKKQIDVVKYLSWNDDSDTGGISETYWVEENQGTV